MTLIHLEEEFPRATKAGKFIGKAVRCIAAFFLSIVDAMVKSDPPKKKEKKKDDPLDWMS